MCEEKLALLGGPKFINKSFKPFNTFTNEETNAVVSVMNSGVLSQYLGCWHEDFYGGPSVRAFEREWAEFFNVSHEVAVNSATSGLMAAIGAIGIEPGDEVIVSPWTMSASATAIMVFQGVPVFADIEDETFNLDIQSIRNNINERTKAIVVPDIFGHSADLKAINLIAKEYNLKVIEDAAQAPYAKYYDKYVGTVADIGVFSLNYHKHIHTGEGGMCVTNDPKLAERLQLIRNHAEAVVRDKPVDNYVNLVGFNFRLGEIEAAIGRVQLKKLAGIAEHISNIGKVLSAGLKDLPGLKVPVVMPNCTHVYYVYPLVLDLNVLPVSRAKIVEALIAEGVPALDQGYENIHLLPIYQNRIAFGKHHFPWNPAIYKGDVSYNKGICPVAEKLHDSTFMCLLPTMYHFEANDLDWIIGAFKKVWAKLGDLV